MTVDRILLSRFSTFTLPTNGFPGEIAAPPLLPLLPAVTLVPYKLSSPSTASPAYNPFVSRSRVGFVYTTCFGFGGSGGGAFGSVEACLVLSDKDKERDLLEPANLGRFLPLRRPE